MLSKRFQKYCCFKKHVYKEICLKEIVLQKNASNKMLCKNCLKKCFQKLLLQPRIAKKTFKTMTERKFVSTQIDFKTLLLQKMPSKIA